MKRIVLAGVACLAVAGAANAADLRARMPVKAAPPPAPVYDWNGFYAGVYRGTSIGRSEASSSVTPGRAEVNDTSFSGGLTVGYNWQFAPNGLLGIEGDIGWLGTKRSIGSFDEPFNTVGVKATWYDTIRARLGYVTGPSLLYVTGGAASAHVEQTFGGDLGVAPTTSKSTEWGWVAGGGIETKISRNWSAKTEYLYVDLGSNSFAATTVGGVETATFKNQFHAFKTGLNYKLDGNGFEGLPFFLAPLSSPQRWAGLYAGVNAGGGLSLVHTPNAAFTGFAGGEADLNGTGFAGGGQIGYNWLVYKNWIAGIEGDIGYFGVKNDYAEWGNTGAGLYQPGVNARWYSTLRGRLGSSSGPAFMYATGGLAVVNVQNSVVVGTTGASIEGSRVGWTFGGGIETELTSRWSARLEYLYMNVGTQTVSTPIGSVDFKNHFQVVRAGLNYKFDSVTLFGMR